MRLAVMLPLLTMTILDAIDNDTGVIDNDADTDDNGELLLAFDAQSRGWRVCMGTC